MGIRETLNQNPAITTGGTAAIILVALGFILWQSFGGGGSSSGVDPTKAFFTIDGGKTHFVDSAKKIPPFDKDGKTAVQAFIYTCDGGKTKFVGYLKRYTPDAKKKLEEAQTNPNKSDPMLTDAIDMTGAEYRGPNDPENKWITPANSKDYSQWANIVNVKCPNGKAEPPEAVFP